MHNMVHLEEYTLIRTLIFSVFISVLQKTYKTGTGAQP